MTSHPLFPSQEIGSLMKPFWQLQGARGGPLDERARKEFHAWDERIHFTRGAETIASALLSGSPGSVTPEQVRDLGALFGLRYFESAGLDRVYDAEARRIEMYEYPIRQMRGFQFFGHVRSFDNKYYLKAANTGEIRLERPYHTEEFEFVRAHARAEPK
ncbi:methionine synthase (B12-independent), partial [mine drainage metagenome]